jgi:hypothetical protein
MVALRQTLNPQDELKIIMDRRSRPASEPATRPGIERRRHPHIDVALNVDGFAIVPASASNRPPAYVRTAPSPAVVRDDAEAKDTERREDKASVDDADPQGHPVARPGPSDPPPRAPHRQMRNPLIQRLYPEEPRDEALDDGGRDGTSDRADDAESLSRVGTRPPRFPDTRISSRSALRPQLPRSRHRYAPFDDHDEPRRGRSTLLWVVLGLVAVIGVLAFLGMGQIEAFKARLATPGSSLATPPAADPPSVDQTREPPSASPAHASDATTDKPPSATPSPAADLARKAEPEPAEASRAPVPPPELPARQWPRPAPASGPEPKRPTGSPAKMQSSTAVRRPEAAARPSPGLPRVELVRSPAPRSSGSGGTYVVRISDTAGRPLPGAEASLVAQMGDGSAVGIPLEPGPEPGEYRATIPPHDRALRDLRVRITTSDTRFEVPVER